LSAFTGTIIVSIPEIQKNYLRLNNIVSMPELEYFNDQQREAILCETKRVLVLAGAGSGKTKTLIQKLLYLIQHKQVKPSNILAITFTKNATNEMLDRLIVAGETNGKYEQFINAKHISRKEKDTERFKQVRSKPWVNNLTVRTFHSLCYYILKNYGGSVYDNKFRLILEDDSFESAENFKGRAPERPFELLHKILIEKCKDKTYLLTLKRYILDFYVDRIFMEEKLKQSVYKTETKYTTLRGEKVRSKSERDIADWLYRHSIKYAYEPEIYFKDFEFKPDFFIPQADLYIEHVSDKSFPMNEKEQQFAVSGHTLVKTYESMTQNSNLFNLALERIVMGKIRDNISQIVSLSFEEEFKSYHDKIEEFLKMCMRVSSMAKGDNIPFEKILCKAKESNHDRVKIFYDLSLPLLAEYKNCCIKRSYLDFDDLLIETINLLENHAQIRTLFQHKFRYILVDEFQDVNSLQVKLLKLLATEESQLFCVGDDWQSIYGFRGSEVDYIINF
jgi:DNA helicase-4